MSWSPDSEWLSYTVVSDATHDALRPGWLFASALDRSDPVGHQRPSGGRSAAEAPIYRIWTTHRDGETSVLIEESRWPLTVPSWSPRGKSIAFGRFVPVSIEATKRFSAADWKLSSRTASIANVLWSVPELALDSMARSDLQNLAARWSPDGLYLAVPAMDAAAGQLCGQTRKRCTFSTMQCNRPGRPMAPLPSCPP